MTSHFTSSFTTCALWVHGERRQQSGSIVYLTLAFLPITMIATICGSVYMEEFAHRSPYESVGLGDGCALGTRGVRSHSLSGGSRIQKDLIGNLRRGLPVLGTAARLAGSPQCGHRHETRHASDQRFRGISPLNRVHPWPIGMNTT